MVTQEQLQQAADLLVVHFQPEKIILFGSQARGTANSRSDVDLMIIKSIVGDRRPLLVEAYRVLRGFGFSTDLVWLTPDEFELDRQLTGTIARPASLEGKVLYERA